MASQIHLLLALKTMKCPFCLSVFLLSLAQLKILLRLMTLVFCRHHWLTFSWKSVSHNPIKCYKLIKCWGLRGPEEIVQFTKRNQPDESLRSVFGQHDLLSIEHNVDLGLTLPFLLGLVPWSLSTPDTVEFPPKLTIPNFCMLAITHWTNIRLAMYCCT